MASEETRRPEDYEADFDPDAYLQFYFGRCIFSTHEFLQPSISGGGSALPPELGAIYAAEMKICEY